MTADQPSQAAQLQPQTVDARGHRCPMPLLMAKRALNALAVGQQLDVVATDETSLNDFRRFAQQSGHRLLQAEQRGDEYHIRLEKCAIV